jgi:hypothetical protein
MNVYYAALLVYLTHGAKKKTLSRSGASLFLSKFADGKVLAGFHLKMC